ncbi:dual specificity protein kinase yak1 [Cryptotrichosporon argae]
MSRPSSYHDAGYDDAFSLPLFAAQHAPPPHPHHVAPQQQQQHAPPAPPHRSLYAESSPASAHAHTQRQSVHLQPYYNGAPPAGPSSPRLAGSAAPAQGLMSSAVPYSAYPYSASAGPDDLVPPPQGGTLGSLARSTSLGAARRKDPFVYPSDDIESGMGAGSDTHDWAAAAYGATANAPYYAQREAVPSPSRPPVDRSMPPPPVPAARQHQSATNPYIPRMPDQPAYYRRASDHVSAHAHAHAAASSGPPSPLPPAASASPHSPVYSPYEASPLPSTPAHSHAHSINLPSPGLPLSAPARDASMPPPNVRASSHQGYPASQPTTPARYDPPSRTSQHDVSRQGFREVRGWADMKPVVNPHPAGRRADPNVPGAYLSPLKCMTSELPQTYLLCNPSFKYQSSDNPRRVLTKPSKPAYNDGADNEDGDYILYVNDVLGGEHGGDRYLILDVLGQGTFGQVVKCQNMRTHNIVAVKVVKNKPAYLNQSKMEVAILELLNRNHDPDDKYHILRLLDSFSHKNHLCLVFECLSSNLYELIKQNQFKGLSLQLVKVFTQQLLECLSVLKDARLIHCDLKPENILLKSLQSPQIKVIDFGSACHELQTVYTYIQSRFYRSPEVLLGLPYSAAVDMWSLGCIVVELFLGLPLFPGTSEYNQLSRIIDMLGTPAQHLLENGKQTSEFFNFAGVDATGRKLYKFKSMEQYASEKRTNEQPSKQWFQQTKLPDIIMEYPVSKKNAKQSDIDKEMAQRRAFVDFVQGLLSLDPVKRWSPQQAAKHPFITGEKFTGPFVPPSAPGKRTPVVAAPEPVSTPQKKYGGLVQSPSSNRTQRVYSDAAAYNQQLAQHQYQTAQAHQQQQQAQTRAAPFSPGYDQYKAQRVVSHNPPSQSTWAQHPVPPSQGQSSYSGRVPSQSLSGSTSHANLRTNPAALQLTTATTNPPPSSYYPASRNRANTINQMDAIPPALARLTNLGAPDPSGSRSTLTPVLNRDDMLETWERRQSGGGAGAAGVGAGGLGGKRTSMQHNTTYAQLEYLQEQADLIATNQGGYMPGQYTHHRGSQSISGPSQTYPMQPPIGAHGPQGPHAHALAHRSHHPQHGSVDYRSRPPAGEYDPPLSAGSSRAFLPAYPPPAAHQANAAPGATGFDAFGATADTGMGIMYTPLQPQQYVPAYAGQGSGGGQAQAQGQGQGQGHSARSSFSGSYGHSQQRNNPFDPSSPGYRRGGGGSYSGV